MAQNQETRGLWGGLVAAVCGPQAEERVAAPTNSTGSLGSSRGGSRGSSHGSSRGTVAPVRGTGTSTARGRSTARGTSHGAPDTQSNAAGVASERAQLEAQRQELDQRCASVAEKEQAASQERSCLAAQQSQLDQRCASVAEKEQAASQERSRLQAQQSQLDQRSASMAEMEHAVAQEKLSNEDERRRWEQTLKAEEQRLRHVEAARDKEAAVRDEKAAHEQSKLRALQQELVQRDAELNARDAKSATREQDLLTHAEQTQTKHNHLEKELLAQQMSADAYVVAWCGKDAGKLLEPARKSLSDRFGADRLVEAEEGRAYPALLVLSSVNTAHVAEHFEARALVKECGLLQGTQLRPRIYDLHAHFCEGRRILLRRVARTISARAAR